MAKKTTTPTNKALDEIIQHLSSLHPSADPDGFNGLLETISRMIFPDGLSMRYLPIDDLREQDLNAQSMSKQMFDQLVSNIQTSGVMESIPLCCTIKGQGGQIWLVSGHHRKRAAAAAQQSHMLVLVYWNLTPDRMRSKQLAHNSIAGTSDPELVKRIWDMIGDVKAQFEAFIDPRMFDAIPPTISFKPVDVDIANQAKSVLILFLPVQHSDFEDALKAANPKGDLDKVYLASKDTYDQWIEALQAVRQGLDIVSVPTAIAAMARLAMERLQELEPAE